MLRRDGHVRAGRQAHQITGVRQPGGFVEIVHSPDQAAVGVAPGAEILHVQVAHRQRFGPRSEIAADLRPDLRPAIVGGAHERKQRRFHLGVLQFQIVGNQGDVGCEPRLVSLGAVFDGRQRFRHGTFSGAT